MPDPSKTPTGLSPSTQSPQEARKKVVFGRLLVGLIGGVAIAAFALYLFITVYGVTTGQ